MGVGASAIGSLIALEWQDRENRRMGRLLKAARLRQDACLAGVRCSPRGSIDKAVLRDLSTCHSARSPSPRRRSAPVR